MRIDRITSAHPGFQITLPEEEPFILGPQEHRYLGMEILESLEELRPNSSSLTISPQISNHQDVRNHNRHGAHGGGGISLGGGHPIMPSVSSSQAKLLIPQSPDSLRLAASSVPVVVNSFTISPSTANVFPHSFAFTGSPASFSLDPNPFFPPNRLSFQHPVLPDYPVKRARFYSHNVSSMAGEVRQRPRNLSPSSIDRDIQLNVKPVDVVNELSDLPELKSTKSSPNPKKRSYHSLNDSAEYPRRRAIIAVGRLKKFFINTHLNSVKYVGRGSQDAMVPNQSANSAQS
jgi:hypothetical protein